MKPNSSIKLLTFFVLLYYFHFKHVLYLNFKNIILHKIWSQTTSPVHCSSMAATWFSVNSQTSANFFQSFRLRCLYARSHIIPRTCFVSGEWSNLNVNGDSLWRLSRASVLVWKGNEIMSSSEKVQRPGAEISMAIPTAQTILFGRFLFVVLY